MGTNISHVFLRFFSIISHPAETTTFLEIGAAALDKRRVPRSPRVWQLAALLGTCTHAFRFRLVTWDLLEFELNVATLSNCYATPLKIIAGTAWRLERQIRGKTRVPLSIPYYTRVGFMEVAIALWTKFRCRLLSNLILKANWVIFGTLTIMFVVVLWTYIYVIFA